MNKLFASLLLLGACNLSTEENLGFTVIGQTRWAIDLGDQMDDRGRFVGVDSVGDVVVVGDGPRRLGDEGYFYISPFITKRAAGDGAERWSLNFVGRSTGTMGISAMAITPEDNIVIAGTFSGKVDFGGQTHSTTNAFFVAKYASDGTLIWCNTPHTEWFPMAVAVDANGSIYMSSISGNGDGRLFAFDSAGAQQWDLVISDPQRPHMSSMALAANGDLLFAGQRGTPSSVLRRTFIDRYSNEGTKLSSREIGSSAPWTSWTPRIQLDAAGRIVLQESGSDETHTMGWETERALVRVLSDDGAEQWTKDISSRGSLSPLPRTLFTTPGGAIASAAWTDSVDAGGTLAIAAFDEDGTESATTLGTRMDSASAPTVVSGSAVSSTGALVFTGQFAGKLDFGTGPIATTTSATDTDVFIVVVDPPL